MQIYLKNGKIMFFQNISKLVLQIGFRLLSKVGKNTNNLNFKSQVIWSGQSEDIDK